MSTAAEALQKAFSGFSQVAKRAPSSVAAVEIDLGKVGIALGKAAFEHGSNGNVELLEKAVDEIDALLSKALHDPSTDVVVVPDGEVAKRFVPDVEKGTAEQYDAAHGSGQAGLPMTTTSTPSKKPAAGAGKELQYTGGSGPADQASEKDKYTGTATTSTGTTPSGGDGTSFDQTPGGPNAGKVTKARKAQQPAHPETPGSPGMLLTEDEVQPQEPMVSEGFAMRGAKAKKVAKAAGSEEVRWARDMAAERDDEIDQRIEKAAKRKAAGEGALDGQGDSDDDGLASEATDDRSDASAKKKTAKAKKGTGKAQFDGPEETVDDLEDEDREAQAAAATKPNTENDLDGPAESVDEVAGGKRAAKTAKGKTSKDYDDSKEVDETDDEDEDEDDEEDAKKTAKAKKPFAGAAKPFGSKDDDGDEDEDEDDEDGDEKDEKKSKKAAKVAKSADEDDTVWEKDMAPAVSPTRRSDRLTSSEVPLAARPGTRATAVYAAKIRKAALSGDVAIAADVRAQYARHKSRVAKRADYLDDPTRGGIVKDASRLELDPSGDDD